MKGIKEQEVKLVTMIFKSQNSVFYNNNVFTVASQTFWEEAKESLDAILFFWYIEPVVLNYWNSIQTYAKTLG